MSKSHSATEPANSTDLTFVSLYSGCGGMDLGFAKAGFTPIWANDIAPDAVNTYNKLELIKDPNWVDAAARFKGHKSVCGDVRVASAALSEGMADLVIGGPPCQGFSVAGRMDPNDPRSRHVFDFLGLVKRIRPKAFVMENVAALARNKRWEDIIRSLKESMEDDYKVSLVILNASHWGVPQARERMFLIGIPHDAPDLDLSEGPTRLTPPTVRDALKSLPPAGLAGNDSLCTASITLAKSPVLRRSPYAGMLFNGQGRAMNLDAPAPTLPASMGGNRTPIVDDGDLAGTASPWIVTYHERLFHDGREPLPTLPAGANLRRITVEEAAVIQSFPRDTPWQGRQSARFRQIGNAVPPMLAYAVGKAVMGSLSGERAAESDSDTVGQVV